MLRQVSIRSLIIAVSILTAVEVAICIFLVVRSGLSQNIVFAALLALTAVCWLVLGWVYWSHNRGQQWLSLRNGTVKEGDSREEAVSRQGTVVDLEDLA